MLSHTQEDFSEARGAEIGGGGEDLLQIELTTLTIEK